VIRTNLSTRPFYNERMVYLCLAALAAVVVAATAFNVSRVLRYSRSDTQLATQASHDESRAVDLRRQAAQLRASVDPRQVDFAAALNEDCVDLILSDYNLPCFHGLEALELARERCPEVPFLFLSGSINDDVAALHDG
jgi:CheY-like chemotaxis protein